MPSKTAAIGSKLPEFTLSSTSGNAWKPSAAAGRNLVVYFYPRDNTPGCTREACDFRDAFPALRRRHAVVLGVSADSAESHREFRSEWKLPFPLLVDARASVARKYGVWREKQNFGKRYMGIVRSTFVIDPAGRLVRVFRNVKVEGHVHEVTESIDSGLGE